jgi:hypothetical protein
MGLYESIGMDGGRLEEQTDGPGRFKLYRMVLNRDDVSIMRESWGIVLALALGVGCVAPRPPLSVKDPDPSIKIPAMKVAVEKKDLAAACQMVRDLESDDPAVRLYAIEALFRLTGERFGYLFYADDDQREASVKQWRHWAAQQGCEGFEPPATGPAGGGEKTP